MNVVCTCPDGNILCLPCRVEEFKELCHPDQTRIYCFQKNESSLTVWKFFFHCLSFNIFFTSMLYNDITNYYSTNYKIQLHRLSCFGPKMARWSQYHQSADDGVCHSLWLHLCQALLPTWSLQRWYHWNRQLWRISVWKGQIVSVEAQKYNDSLAISTHNFKTSWYNIQRFWCQKLTWIE